MKRILTIAIAAIALGGCAQPTPIAASPEVVAKCGPPPTPSFFGESRPQYEQRVAVYMLCGRGDPAYPAALAASIQADREQAEQDALWAIQNQLQYQQGQDLVNQSQANFWNMVGAMNGLPH